MAEKKDIDEPLDSIELFGSGKVEFSKPLLVMESLRICIKNRSKEMRAGYTTEKLDKFGNVYREVIPDARKEWISSVIALRNLLSPESKKDKTFLDVEKEINTQKNNLFNEYGYVPYSSKIVINPNDQFRNKETVFFIDPKTKKFMPEPGSSVEVLYRNGILKKEKGAWDSNVDLYIQGIVILYDDLFAELNDLIERLGYFKKRAVQE